MVKGGLVPHNPFPKPFSGPAHLLRELDFRVDSLYAASRAAEWRLARASFAAALERSVCKRFAEGPITRENLQEYLDTLHVDDLVLASACMEGSEAAWECFVQSYRSYLRAVAVSITTGSRSGTDAQELADSLFAELFGLVDGKRGEVSLFRYFHGRSSLKTWLRAILAQRHIDRVRQSRRWESIEREDGEEEKLLPSQNDVGPSPDPHRSKYIQRFLLALSTCLNTLHAQDRKRLELYYARAKTLAEIGRLLGEHESTVSRNLERAGREIRAKVEDCLRTGHHSDHPSRDLSPLDDAQIALCFQYASEDAPIDFRKIFPEKPAGKSESGRKESS